MTMTDAELQALKADCDQYETIGATEVLHLIAALEDSRRHCELLKESTP